MSLKKILFIAALICMPVSVFAGNPIIGAAGFDADTPKGSLMLKMIERNINAAAYMTGAFDIINTNLMYDQLSRFGCTGEICAVGFARDAGISVFILSSSREEGDTLFLDIRAYGTDLPYGGKVFCEKTYAISGWNALAPQNTAYIAEEISYRFFSDMLEQFERAVPCSISGEAIVCAEKISGKYSVVEKYGEGNGFPLIRTSGSVVFSNGSAPAAEFDAGKKYYILVGYLRKADELREYITGRKSEMVFYAPSYTETAYIAVLTPLLAATMPLTAPLGYYARGDYAGLALWGINYAPWAYCALREMSPANPFTDFTWSRISKSDDVHEKIKRKEPVSSRERAGQWFFYYMALSGNVPLFADAAAGYGLDNVRVFKGKEPYLGNDATAVLLSVAGGGGGMFFKGQRRWGYFYFHANNILVYSSLSCLLGEKKMNAEGKYTDVHRDRTKGYALCAAYAVFKAVEITHTLVTDERIYSGETASGSWNIAPVLNAGGSENFYGAAASYAF